MHSPGRILMGYILDFKPVVKKHYFCEHIIAATIAKYYGRTSEFGFIRSMNVNVNEEESDISDRLEYEKKYFVEDLQHFHGICFGPEYPGDYDFFVKKVGFLEYNKEFPETVFCINCKNTGPLLFMGKDVQYHFIDIHGSKKQMSVDLEYLRKNMVAYRKIILDKEEFCFGMSREKMEKEFIRCLQRDGFCEKTLMAIREYRDLLESCDDFSQFYCEYEDTKFSDSLTRIFAGRNNFYDFIAMLADKYQSQHFAQIAEKIIMNGT